VYLAAKLTVAFGYEYSRIKPERLPQPVHHRWDLSCRRSDDQRVGQGRAAKDFLARAQRDEHATRHVIRVRLEGGCGDRPRRWISRLQSIQNSDNGQTKVLAVGFADGERAPEIDAKRPGRCLVENRDGTIIGAEEATATDRENTHLGFFLRLN